MSLPEAYLENLELGLCNVCIHNDERESRISKDYLSDNNVSLHNGKGMYRDLKEEDVEEEEEDDDDIEADILRQSGYATIKKSCNQPMPVKEEVEEDNITAVMRKQSGYGNEEDEDEEEEEDDIPTDILKQSGYGSMKKPLHLSTPKTAAPVKLVSALRGGREKEGIPAKNLSVTWSPDVYNPNPSPETIVIIKKPLLKTDSNSIKIQEFKKNGKPMGKDKGKGSKGCRHRGGGGSSKDKKRKYSNNSRRSYGSFDNDD